MAQKEFVVDRIAALAKLHLIPAERECMERELSSVIAFAEMLADTENAETKTIPPTAMREDNVHQEISREELLKNAPTTCEGYLTVPRLMEDV